MNHHHRIGRLAGLAVALLSFAVSVSACGATSQAASDLGTAQSGKLMVGTDLTYPPYDTRVDGKPAGFDIEFVNALGKEMHLTPQYLDTRFAQIIAGVKAGRYDMIASTLYVSGERAKQVDFVPYFQTGNSIIVRKGTPMLATPQDLCGKTVGVVTATVIAKTMSGPESATCRKAGKGAIQVKEFPTDPEATQALLSGQVDAQMTDGAVAKSAVDASSGRLELSSSHLVYPVAVGLAVKKGNEKLKKAIEDGIAEMKKSGAYDALLKKYNLEPVDPSVLAESMKR